MCIWNGWADHAVVQYICVVQCIKSCVCGCTLSADYILGLYMYVHMHVQDLDFDISPLK